MTTLILNNKPLTNQLIAINKQMKMLINFIKQIINVYSKSLIIESHKPNE